MDKAAELLAADDLSVTEVSLSLGYSDLYAFSGAFCRHYGISPSDSRLQRGQDRAAGPWRPISTTPAFRSRSRRSSRRRSRSARR
ncbi:helix-turn-helix domain-containing protein [Paenibacillus humicus]